MIKRHKISVKLIVWLVIVFGTIFCIFGYLAFPSVTATKDELMGVANTQKQTFEVLPAADTTLKDLDTIMNAVEDNILVDDLSDLDI